MSSQDSFRTSLRVESTVFAGRHLVQWRRNPAVPLQALLFPTLLLIVYYLLVSKSMARLTGGDGIDVVVSMCALAGGFSGALAAGLAIPGERDNGLLSRFWVQPVHRSSAVTGMLLAEAARTTVATALITAVGMLLGLRFHGGLASVAIFVVIPVLWVAVYAAIVLVVALRCQSRTMLTWLSTFSLGAVFASSAVVPMDIVPGWLQPALRLQPMSPTIEAMRALARGGPALAPLMWTAVWIVVLGVASGVLAVRSYRAAAQSAH
jgi:ABC-2 type transport system permease protein